MVGERISGAGKPGRAPGGTDPTHGGMRVSRARARRPSVVVARPADVAVVGERPRRVGGGREVFLVEAVVQDGDHALVGAGPEVQRAGAGPLEPRGRVALLERRGAEEGAGTLV